MSVRPGEGQSTTDGHGSLPMPLPDSELAAIVHPERFAVFAARGDFGARADATAWLNRAGFSVARLQANAPSGVLFGSFDIQKWRNLSKADRQALHGQMFSHRGGPATIRLFPDAPAEAIAAFRDGTGRGRLQLGNSGTNAIPFLRTPDMTREAVEPDRDLVLLMGLAARQDRYALQTTRSEAERYLFTEEAKSLRSILSRYRKMEEALKRIASCQPHHEDDVVSVARQALGGSQ